ncbi:MAG: hypothetical protein U0L98_07520 [Clostridia bacterium]|nr:hypothetical protein [Clostridia bacterium]
MKQVQELLEDNQEKLGLTDKNLKKLIKTVRGVNNLRMNYCYHDIIVV